MGHDTRGYWAGNEACGVPGWGAGTWTDMGARAAQDLAMDVVATLRAHEAELRAAGIRRLPLFGSVGRGEAEGGSDVIPDRFEVRKLPTRSLAAC